MTNTIVFMEYKIEREWVDNIPSSCLAAAMQSLVARYINTITLNTKIFFQHMFDVIVELVFLLLERMIILSQLFSVSKLSLLSLLSSSSWLNEQRRWWQAERLLNRTFDFVIGRLRCCCVDFAGFWFTSSSQLDDTELFKSCPVRFIVQLDFKGSVRFVCGRRTMTRILYFVHLIIDSLSTTQWIVVIRTW